MLETLRCQISTMAKSPLHLMWVFFTAAAMMAWSELACAGCLPLPDVDKVIQTDQITRTLDSHEDERELHDFALFSYRNIVNDVLTGRGPFLDTLVFSLGSPCHTSAEMTPWLRTLLTRSSTPTDFARQIAVAHSLAVQAPEN